MFCDHCGTQLPDNARFCPRCGKAVNAPSSPAEEQKKRSYTTSWSSQTKGPAAQRGQQKEEPRTTSWSFHDKGSAAPAENRAGKLPVARRLLSFAKAHKVVTAVCCVVLVFAALSISNDIYFAMENARIAARKEASQGSAVSNSSGKASSSFGGGSSSAGSSKSSDKTAKVDKSSTTVPDLGAFLGGCVRDAGTSDETYSYDIDDDKGMAAIDEYRALLTGSYNFQEVNFKKEDFTSTSGLICYNIYYSYTGSGSVGSKRWPSAEQEADLYLLVNHYTWEDRVGISMSLGDGIVVENSGVTASDPPTDMSGAGNNGSGSGSGGGVYTPEFAKQDCSICKGTGKCQTCGGRGYLYSTASKKYDRNCTGCRNASGKCTYCNGTGKR